jgi:hypothetical protein
VLVTINVDVNNLWKTAAPFKVYSAEYMRGAGRDVGLLYRGYVIKMSVDPRDLTFDYAAHIYNENTVCITAPALGHHDVGKDRDVEAAAQEAKPDPREDLAVIWEAIEHGRLDFSERKIDNTMSYHLVFNGGVSLNSEVLEIHQGNANGRLALEAFNIGVDLPVARNPVFVVDDEGQPLADANGHFHVIDTKVFMGFLLWRVADVTHGTRKHHTGLENRNATEGFEAMFGNMNIG